MPVLAAAFAILPLAAKADTYVSGSITSNTTWTADTYFVTDDVTVNSGVRLTINPGATVKFGSRTNLYISGTLVAEGTASNTIVFTASSTSPTKGYWDRIEFDSSSSGTISQASVLYGGNQNHSPYSEIYNNGGTLTLDTVEVADSDSRGVQQNSGTMKILNGNYHAEDYGVMFEGGTGTVSGNNFHDLTNGGVGVYGDSSGNLTLTNNTFSNMSYPAMFYLTGSVQVTHSGNTVSGTGHEHGFYIGGTMGANQTLTGDGFPYLSDGLKVAAGKTLTMTPGATLKFQGGGLEVAGTLAAEGNTASSIYFTSYYDDTNGDVDNYSPDTAPAASDWDGITIDSGASSTISNAKILYGGSVSIGANIYNNGGTLTLDSDEVATGYAYGVKQNSGTANILNCNIHADGTYGVRVNGGTATISSGTIAHNGSYGIYVGSGSNVAVNSAAVYSQSNGLYVDGGTLALNFTEVATSSSYGIYQGSGTSTIISNSIHNNGYGLYAIGGVLARTYNIFANNTVDTYINGATGGISKSGTVTQDETWANTIFPYIIGSSGLTVTTGATLTINPGVVVKFDGTTSTLTVNGSLRAEGDASDIIYFTSSKDDLVGGDSNLDGASSGATGDWSDVVIGSSGTGTISYAVARYGGHTTGILNDGGGTLNVSNAEVATSNQYGIYVTGGTANVAATALHHNFDGATVNAGTLNISSSDIRQNGTGVAGAGIYVNSGTANVTGNAIHIGQDQLGVFNNTGVAFTADNNWWGTDVTAGSCDMGYCSDGVSNVTVNTWRHNDTGFSVRDDLLNDPTLTWTSTSTYMTELNSVTNTWNSSASGMGIVAVSSTTQPTADIAIYDNPNAPSATALGVTVTYPSQLNTKPDVMFLYKTNVDNQYNNVGWKYGQWVLLHEMGHALGLGHYYDVSDNGEVMYADDVGNIDFGNKEKDDYTFLWNTMKWASPFPNWWP